MPGFRRGRARSVEELFITATAAACHPERHDRVADLVQDATDDVLHDLPALAEAHRVAGCVHAMLADRWGRRRRARKARRRPSRGGVTSSRRARRAGTRRLRARCRWYPMAGVQGPGAELVDVLRPRYAALLRPRRPGATRPLRRGSGHDGGRRLLEPRHVLVAAGVLPCRCDRVQRGLDQCRPPLARDVQVPGPPLVPHRSRTVVRGGRTVDIGGRKYATFDKVDTVFHLALHASARVAIASCG